MLDCGRNEAMTMSEPKVCLEIGSRTENVELVQIAVKASLQQLKLDTETSQSIGTAVREAVANAIQHGNSMDPGKHVRIECCIEGDEVVIQVRDQGIGLDEESVSHAFERFYRGRQAQSHAEQGTGLGLPVAKAIVDAHGGEIDLRARQEGGAVAMVVFPVEGSLRVVA